jgi:hypothetical protein
MSDAGPVTAAQGRIVFGDLFVAESLVTEDAHRNTLVDKTRLDEVLCHVIVKADRQFEEVKVRGERRCNLNYELS